MKKLFGFKNKPPSNEEIEKLHKAASEGNIGKLEHYAKLLNVNEVDKQNRTALQLACADGKVEAVKFLLEKKANPNLFDNQNKSPLMKAVEGQHEQIVNILLENNADPNLADMNGNTALHLAARFPSHSIVVLLMKYKADINAQNLEGFSPLTVAIQESKSHMAEFLLKKGADVNILDKNKRSPLMAAAGKGHSSIVQLLLQLQADTKLKDNKGQSAEVHAKKGNYDDCALLITKHVPQGSQAASKRTSKSDMAKDAENKVFSSGGQKAADKHRENDTNQLLMFINQIEDEHSEKLDALEDLGVDWDKISNTSRKTLPEDSAASPTSNELLVCSSPSIEDQEVDSLPKATQKNTPDVKQLKSHTPLTPRLKKILPENEKSDDILPGSSYEFKGDNQHRKGVFKAGSPTNTPFANLAARQRWSRVAQGAVETVSMKKASSFCDTGGRAAEGLKLEKHDKLEKREKSPTSRKSPDVSRGVSASTSCSSKPPVESPSRHRTSSINRADDLVVEKPSQLTAVSKSLSTKSPQRNVKVLRLNDDSTLSDMSDDEGRWQTKEKKKKLHAEDIEISEELDEITSSSSLTADDCDLHVSTSKDPARKFILDEIASQQSKHPILKPKDPHGSRAGVVSKLKNDNAELKNQLEEVKDDRCVMEHKEMEMQSEIADLRLQLKQREENASNIIRLCHGNQEKLEEELRHAISQLNEERCLTAHLQQRFKSQSCKQQTIEEDYKRAKNIEEHLRSELEMTQAHCSNKQRDLVQENETIKDQLEGLRQDLKLCEETKTKNMLDCNNTIQALNCELTMANNRLENEQKDRDALVAQTQAIRSHLAETERARSENERTLVLQKEESQRQKDKLANEMASQREAANKQSQKLVKSRARVKSLENDKRRAEILVKEKNQQLTTMQRENVQIATRIKEMEAALRAEKDMLGFVGGCKEATEARLTKTQSEIVALRQKLEEAQNKCIEKESAVTDAQKNFSDIVSKLRTDSEERIHLAQGRTQDLVAQNSELREQIHQMEMEKNEREAQQRDQQTKLADSSKKLSKCEASLEVYMNYRSDSEEEKARLLKETDKLKRKLDDRDSQILQVEKRVSELRSRLDEREKELTVALQKQKEALSAATTSNNTVRQLEETVQRQRLVLKSAKRRLRDQQASEVEREKVSELQAELKRQMSFRSLMERNKKHLEEEVQNLRRKVETSQMEQRQVDQYRREIEDKARQEVQKKLQEVNLFLQSQAATQEAQEQIKASSELSLRAKIQELEGDLRRATNSQNETIIQMDTLQKDLKRYRQMHREEQWLRKSLTADLKRSNSRLAEANAKLLSEQCKSFVASGPPGGVTPLASTSSQLGPPPYRGHSTRILASVAEGQGSNVEEYLAKKVQSKSSCPPRTKHLAEPKEVTWK
ncbi:ankyrin repeat domain-containing protein 26-like isoform X1 [Nerophis lumbriciformis]|uniref:ankyrin repeat domain-containing protein 26-like isoform X1 n=1 Tax=Nerophis lumbriciformis TaxID=546530 RepID=UPI002ADF96B5|nr:ankyrin repeat domain-containing protein 26-like isoform X1 [Nerophis lumbriciformis]XP_061780859.1 ankyrin repeat domain-containing protein 26-like isoform X1 [Nerophis lumbriciformis]